MPDECGNCGDALAKRRYHIYLETNEVLEAPLCVPCRDKFAAAEWVALVI